MEENNNEEEGKIIYDENEKTLVFPKNYDDLINQICSLYHFSEEEKYINISYKDLSGDTIKISTSEEYLEFLSKIKQNIIPKIIYISIRKSIKNKIKLYHEDIYDKDEIEEEENDDLFLRQGHIFSNNNKKQESQISENGAFDINKILNESIEIKNNEEFNITNEIKENFFGKEINKSVLPPVTSFPSYCTICQKFPIIKVMYYCNNCKLNLCENCEKNLGYNHRHCIYKIRNKEQYKEIINMDEIEKNVLIRNNKYKKDLNKNKKEDKKLEKIKEKNKKEDNNGLFSSFIKFMTGSNK